jgi:Tfp pilus assembly protein PilF
LDQAAAQFTQALRFDPTNAVAHFSLAGVRVEQGQAAAAVEHYRAALRAKPDFPEALNNFAWLLATHPDAQLRNGAQAVEFAERACRLTDFKVAALLGTLAGAYAEAGRFEDAVKTARRAIELARATGETERAERNAQLLELYLARRPAREGAATEPGKR